MSTEQEEQDRKERERQKELQRKEQKEALNETVFEREEIQQVEAGGPESLIKELEEELKTTKVFDEIREIVNKIDILNRLKSLPIETPEESEEEGKDDRDNDEQDHDQTIDDILGMQKPLIDEIKKGSKDGLIKMFDENGNEIDPASYFTPGQQGPSGFMEIIGLKEGLDKKLEEVYGKFEKLGFAVMKTSEERPDGETSYFFGINFPESYKGNTCPLTMNKAQIKEACDCLANSRESDQPNIFSEVVARRGRTTDREQSREWMQESHERNRGDFLREILERGPQGHKYGLENSNGWAETVKGKEGGRSGRSLGS